VNGIPACANKKLLTDILRGEWGFKGHVISDSAALEILVDIHKYLPTRVEAAAAVVKAGCNLELSGQKNNVVFEVWCNLLFKMFYT